MRCERLDSTAKRLTDILGSALGLALLSPLFLFVAAIVKATSPGPVLFRHKRVGLGRRVFRMYKFRTMVDGAVRFGPEFTTSGDARVTGVGRILRKTKLDELPQLVNVLLGDMSFVGPRPQSLSLAEHYSDEDLDMILSVRPGITGPTQIWLRNEEELLAGRADPVAFYVEQLLPQKIESDRFYVRRRSFWGDLRLLLETAKVVARINRKAPVFRPTGQTAEILAFPGPAAERLDRAA